MSLMTDLLDKLEQHPEVFDNKNGQYFNVFRDLRAYPDVWAIICNSNRGPGKTYSALRGCLLSGVRFGYIRRTIDEVELMCSGDKIAQKLGGDAEFDVNPYKQINEDYGVDVQAHLVNRKIGGFWKHVNGEAQGAPIGYILPLNAVKDVRALGLADVDVLIFDEFIPNVYDRVNRREGEQLMDLYETIARDREKRGRPPVLLLCFGNDTSLNNPLFDLFEIESIEAEMQLKDEEYRLLDERSILLHRIPWRIAAPEDKKSIVERAMQHTAWGQMTFKGGFAYNDLSNIGTRSLRGMKCVCSFRYKNSEHFVYRNRGEWYISLSKHESGRRYNLNLENDQKRFLIDYRNDIRDACIEGNALFQEYLAYDLIINYKRFFKNL